MFSPVLEDAGLPVLDREDALGLVGSLYERIGDWSRDGDGPDRIDDILARDTAFQR